FTFPLLSSLLRLLESFGPPGVAVEHPRSRSVFVCCSERPGRWRLRSWAGYTPGTATEQGCREPSTCTAGRAQPPPCGPLAPFCLPNGTSDAACAANGFAPGYSSA